MSKVSFTIPTEVKEAFDKAFAGQNKSAIIADLMRKAVAARLDRQRRSQDAFQRIFARRGVGPKFTDEEIRAARDAIRPS
mgnify:CR=1 FL=1